jgi:hypothetical protein
MRSLARVQVRPGPRDVRRNPMVCVAMTAVLATTFWLGMIWLAERTVGMPLDQGLSGQVAAVQQEGAQTLQAMFAPQTVKTPA